MANWLTRMNVIREDVVRAIPVHDSLSSFGYVFRSWSNQKNKLASFRRSVPTERISEFWSHSWQLSAWKKILTLLFLKNGFAALCLGTFASLLGFTLSYTQILPSVLGFGGKVSFWSTLFGVITFGATLLLWRNQERVFLDVCCINQVDNIAKSEGILSLGGILKRSEKMLVLWDRSYIERLWCMFELAAFIKSRGGYPPQVEIRPTLLGPCAVAIFAAVLMIVVVLATMISHQQQGEMYLLVIAALLFLLLYPAAATFRHYFHSVDTMCTQLHNFEIHKTQCRCCTMGHENDEDSLCDREIVQRCIQAWFGGEREFEEEMKSVAFTAVSKQLGQHLFPYWLLLVSSVPFNWIMLDLAVENLLFMKLGSFWLFWLITGLGWWLGAFPTLFTVFLFAAKKLRRPTKYLCSDVLVNLLVILALLPAFFVIFGSFTIISLFTPLEEWQSALVCSCFHILLAWIIWYVLPRLLRSKRAGPAEPEESDGHTFPATIG